MEETPPTTQPVFSISTRIPYEKRRVKLITQYLWCEIKIVDLKVSCSNFAHKIYFYKVVIAVTQFYIQTNSCHDHTMMT